MTDLDSMDLFTETPATPTGAGPRKVPRHRHQWERRDRFGVEEVICGYHWPVGPHGENFAECGAIRDPERSRRGRTNRSRGNAIEREIGARLGLRRVGMYGGPDDLSGPLFVAQVKSGGAFPERLWRWLKGVPVNAGQTALLVIADAPGPGHRRRALVVLDIDAWRDLHGNEP